MSKRDRWSPHDMARAKHSLLTEDLMLIEMTDSSGLLISKVVVVASNRSGKVANAWSTTA